MGSNPSRSRNQWEKPRTNSRSRNNSVSTCTSAFRRSMLKSPHSNDFLFENWLTILSYMMSLNVFILVLGAPYTHVIFTLWPSTYTSTVNHSISFKLSHIFYYMMFQWFFNKQQYSSTFLFSPYLAIIVISF